MLGIERVWIAQVEDKNIQSDGVEVAANRAATSISCLMGNQHFDVDRTGCCNHGR